MVTLDLKQLSLKLLPITLFLFVLHSETFSLLGQGTPNESDVFKYKIELEKTGRTIINALRYGKFGVADFEWKKLQAEPYKSEAEYYYLAGSIHYSRLEWPEAKENLTKALAKEPNHEAASYLLGMIYAQEDNWMEAKDTWLETNQISPYNPFYHYNLGVAYYILGEYSKAIDSLSKSLEYKPNYLEAKTILAKTYADTGHYEEAKKEIASILEADPKNNFASNLMGRIVYVTEKDPKKALANLKDERILGWREKKVYARCYYEVRKWRNAEALFRTIAFSPFADDYDQSFYLNLLLNLGLEEKANEFFHFSQKKNKNDSTIAEAYRMLLSSREGKTLLYHYFKVRY
ncbi:tetratricopeptide repeat protein [Leptospira idonii]|uniref:Tetratricopeptide repeat protein n=1 Tax=Leptospira idonii TaxID=1193500 RepID=A0A4R9M404_9LEPT|nr:tetratricopeptide repeat protein [Leptospira idonii]TGN20457.1 tetratricopeptide repeat protein [Leptospira idonii]